MKNKFRSLFALFLAIPLNAVSGDSEEIVMTINKTDVTKSEFEYIYNKNSKAVDRKSIDEYVELFVNYKLKVEAAKEAKMHELPSYLKEFSSYKDQLAIPYLRDKDKEQDLLMEAYKRGKEEIHASHILIKVAEDGSDSLIAFDRISKIYEEIKSGADFSRMAQENSDCMSKRNGGDLGFLQVFSTIYEFENVIYNTKIGEISKPFRSKFGYHIVKVHERRKVFNAPRVAHIYISKSEPKYQEIVDSLMLKIKMGANFAELAKKHSMDMVTAVNGGDLGIIDRNSSYPIDFKNHVYSLSKAGDVKLIDNAIGVQIICLTSIGAQPTFQEQKGELLEKIKKSDREKEVGVSYLNTLKTKYGFELYEKSLKPFEKIINEKDVMINKLNAPLYEFKGNVYPQSEFYPFLKEQKASYDYAYSKGGQKKKMSDKQFIEKAFDSYLTKLLIAEERLILEQDCTEFKNLIQEYSDGLLLFEISSKEVWDKSSKDTAALSKFYQEHKADYTWDSPKFKGVVIRCKNDSVLNIVEQIIKTTPLDSVVSKVNLLLRKKYEKLVKVDEGVFPQGANKVVDEKIYKIGKYADDKYPVATVVGSLQSQPQSYLDIKGPVTADYQMYLEQEWIKSLRSKYPVKLNKKVLNTIKSN